MKFGLLNVVDEDVVVRGMLGRGGVDDPVNIDMEEVGRGL